MHMTGEGACATPILGHQAFVLTHETLFIDAGRPLEPQARLGETLVLLGRSAKAYPPTKLNAPVMTWWRDRMLGGGGENSRPLGPDEQNFGILNQKTATHLNGCRNCLSRCSARKM